MKRWQWLLIVAASAGLGAAIAGAVRMTPTPERTSYFHPAKAWDDYCSRLVFRMQWIEGELVSVAPATQQRGVIDYGDLTMLETFSICTGLPDVNIRSRSRCRLDSNIPCLVELLRQDKAVLEAMKR
jgi:hypothetical protein